MNAINSRHNPSVVASSGSGVVSNPAAIAGMRDARVTLPVYARRFNPVYIALPAPDGTLADRIRADC